MPALSKKHQIPHEWLLQNGPALFEDYSPWLMKYRNEQLSCAEITGVLLILFYQRLYPKNWIAGLQTKHQQDITVDSQIKVSELISKTSAIQISVNISSLSLRAFFSQYRLYRFSFACQMLMKSWFNDNLKLSVEFSIPPALELLKQQANGKRIIWLPSSPNDFLHYHENKDPLEFVQHDLEHAHNFFHKYPYIEQVQFYRELHQDMLAGRYEAKIAAHPSFKADLEYLMSDMNSHPEHLRATLKAIEPKLN